MKITAFHTNEKYKALAEALKASVIAQGFECLLYPMEDTGAWTSNVNHKPSVIKRALEDAAGDSVLYLDADSKMVAFPEALMNTDADVAAYYETPIRPCGGSLWFRSLEKCGALVDEWIKNVSLRPAFADDWQNLQAALVKMKPRILSLPPAYNYHRATMRSRFPGAKPIIEHYCAGSHDYAVY